MHTSTCPSIGVDQLTRHTSPLEQLEVGAVEKNQMQLILILISGQFFGKNLQAQ